MKVFDLYDEHGKAHTLVCMNGVTALSFMREYLSEFKTHCVIEQSKYSYYHFINWLRKYKGYVLTEVPSNIQRIDM